MNEQTVPNQVIDVQAITSRLVVTLGESASLVFYVSNRSELDDYFEIVLQGIPMAWVLLDLPVIHLSPRERREVSITIQAPANSPVSAGQYPLTIQVISQSKPALRGETTVDLQINEYLPTIQMATEQIDRQDAGNAVGVILHTTQFSCPPGETLSIPIVIVNRGAWEDLLTLAVDGLPPDWVTLAEPVTRLGPGAHRDGLIYIHPPFGSFSRAGRHPFSIHLQSQNDPNQRAVVEANLTVTAVGQFSSTLTPRRINAGQTARLEINNTGNFQDTYSVIFQGIDADLDFAPSVAGPIQLMPGETGAIDFAVSPRALNWFGKQAVSTYSVSVQSSGGEAQRSNGEVVSRSLIPVWMIVALGVMCVSLLCGMGFLWNWNQSRIAWQRETEESQVGFLQGQTATADFLMTMNANALTATAAATLSLPTSTEAPTPSPAPSETPVPTLTTTPVPPTDTPPSPTETPPPTNTAPPAEPTATAQPTEPGITLPVTGEQTFVFTSDRGGSPQLYLLQSDVGDPGRFTEGEGTETQAVWSPDGDRIAFTSDQDGNNEIYVVSADGSNPVNLSQNPANDSYPAWSPDGNQLAFVSDRDGNNEIYLMNADGGDPVNISNNPANDFKPAWYAQRVLLNTVSRILFTSDRAGNNEIFAMNTDGAEPENLTNHPANDSLPAVPYDGERAAFVTDRDGNQEIYVMDLDGGNLVNVTLSPARDTKPGWSRDGEWIAFITDRDGNREFYIVRADGESLTNVSNSPSDDIDPAWR